MDQTPTALFDSYESDFKHLISSISDKLEGSGKGLLGEQRKAALRKVEIELDEADDIVRPSLSISLPSSPYLPIPLTLTHPLSLTTSFIPHLQIAQLEIEIQGIPQSIRPPYTSRLKSIKSDHTKYKKLHKESKAQSSRSDLLGSPHHSPPSDDPYGERSDRNRLLKGTETLTDSSRRIQESTSVALETETHGAEILRTLRGQREQIENSRNMLSSADTHIDRASGTLKGMIRHMKRQRYIYSGIGVFFVLMVLTILYFKLFR
ncbi:hypothetical protein CVT24_008123 [Panaeolus cyanescens]|uniref:t-SNARE coiled-coil homology domain-containing protein n=1 Tax=Panaeolus cyanescens TaxID=181874 RepID=A0A409YLJ1_9AGAR|nr:hypothetical protein CVT24_008123 [Panaeolus cyanescens]